MPTGAEVGRASRLVRSSGGAFPAFWSLSCFGFGGLLADMPLFSFLRGFLAGFRVRMYVCIAGVLCVACGAFVRV